ncbi:hypothetical protein LCGC14_2450430 [marine sediment metagenome]|uniref:Uncharacterized protein n=1 Tax=marine sediment metagenome TaxID=412755 RepID=A0A0F9DTE0_9ZZZZ
MWHFLAKDKRLGFNDGRKVVVGRTIRVKGMPAMCCYGLHASALIIDALKYSTANHILCRVDLGGEILRGDDKAVGTERTVLWWIDATDLLAEFACRCAVRALEAAGVKNKWAWKAIAAQRAKGPEAAKEFTKRMPKWRGDSVKGAAVDTVWVACGWLANGSARSAACQARGVFGAIAAKAVRGRDKKDKAHNIAQTQERARQNRSLAAMAVAAHR